MQQDRALRTSKVSYVCKSDIVQKAPICKLRDKLVAVKESSATNSFQHL